jgi:hypothetical protein
MITDTIRQFFCGLQGHDALLHFDKTRISLQCVSCGHETPGWEVRRETRDVERGGGTSAMVQVSSNARVAIAPKRVLCG